MFAQYQKELKSYFTNMIGVTVIALLLILTGIYATIINFLQGYPTFETTVSSVTFIFFLAVPLLTMRSLSEERSAKTDQLLYSLPVGLSKIIIGKYLAMVTVHAAAVAVMSLYPIILSFYGTVNFASAYSALFAFFLLGCALIAIGMFISSLTESVVISAVITLGTFIALYLLTSLALLIPGTALASLICFIVLSVLIGIIVHLMLKNSFISVGTVLVLSLACIVVYFISGTIFEGLFPDMIQTLAVFDRMSMFATYGIFDITGVVYYVSVICLFVYLTVRSMDKRRWS